MGFIAQAGLRVNRDGGRQVTALAAWGLSAGRADARVEFGAEARFRHRKRALDGQRGLWRPAAKRRESLEVSELVILAKDCELVGFVLAPRRASRVDAVDVRLREALAPSQRRMRYPLNELTASVARGSHNAAAAPEF